MEVKPFPMNIKILSKCEKKSFQIVYCLQIKSIMLYIRNPNNIKEYEMLISNIMDVDLRLNSYLAPWNCSLEHGILDNWNKHWNASSIDVEWYKSPCLLNVKWGLYEDSNLKYFSRVKWKNADCICFMITTFEMRETDRAHVKILKLTTVVSGNEN